MTRALAAITLAVCLNPLTLFGQVTPSLRGAVQDPSGAAIPGAVVQLQGMGREQRKTTDAAGRYTFTPLAAGTYNVRITAKGFAVLERTRIEVSNAAVFDTQLEIQAQAEQITVAGQSNGAVTTDPTANADALVLGQKELAALSDDPDELSQQLQALAGPGGGPNGGQIYIDGFTGGQMPPKSSIREIRINSNPFSPEYDKPGFGRIEIFTKPGTDAIRGQIFFQYNNQALNSRSPLLTQTTLPPYDQRFFGGSVSGPLKKNKASYGLDVDQRNITENAFVLATTLDSNLNPQSVSQAVATPQTRTSITPRLDYVINSANTLVMRYQFTRIGSDNQGVGDFNLSSLGFNQRTTENTLQATETAILSPSAVSETRFQFLRTSVGDTGAGTSPQINVAGAFTSGSSTIGASSSLGNHFELANSTSYTHRAHLFKFGFRAREALDTATSRSNFNGTFTFFGGNGPQLDANNRAIAGTSIPLTALQGYQRTLLFQQLGYSADQIRALGGGASQFSITAGTPNVHVNGFDFGLFFNDDWRLRPNLTLSYGIRFETQNNISDHRDIAPRVALAWGIGAKGTSAAKTILRVGAGIFYDRIANTCGGIGGGGCILNSLIYNGVTQQSYLLQNPDFYPNPPSIASLAGSRQPQTLQLLSSSLRAPQTFQTNIGLERQVNSHVRLSVNYISTRGVHLTNTRDINAPVNGVYPFKDSEIRMLTESGGMSRSNQLTVSPNVNYKNLFLFGFYNLSYGMDNNEGQPADPYNLHAEWGPSSFADIRHRGVIGTNIPLPWKLSVSPFINMQSGSPYNITTGRDPYKIGIVTARPALLANVASASCNGGALVYETGFGCFDLAPGSGEQTIARNSGRGPAVVSVNLRLQRTWAFGHRGESGPPGAFQGGAPPAPGSPGGPPPGGPPPGGAGGGPGGGPGGGGPPPGMFGGGASGLRYNLTLSLMANNAINHPNYSSPSGDLSSPYFGESRSLAGNFGPAGSSSAYNRKIMLQVRFSF